MTESRDNKQAPANEGLAGSRIELQTTENRLCLQTSPRGLHWPAVFQLIGGILCLAICGQWTQRTLATSDVGATWVSLPFWLIGIGVVLGAANSMLKHHRIEIDPEAGWIRTLPLGWKRPLRTARLIVRFDNVTRGEADGRGGVDVPVLAIEDGPRVFRLMEGASDAERRWVRGELNTWLARHGRQ